MTSVVELRNKKNICVCGHKKKYHSQDVNSQKYVCRGAFCNCIEYKEEFKLPNNFIAIGIDETQELIDAKENERLSKDFEERKWKRIKESISHCRENICHANGGKL